MQVTARIDDSQLTAREKAFKANVAPLLRKNAETLQGLLSDAIRDEIGPGKSLGSRTGKLRDAFLPGKPGNISEFKDADGLSDATLGIDYDDLPYWRIQNLGGVIKPRNAKYLTVPLNDEARKTTARKVDGLFILVLGKKLFLVKGTAAGGLEFWYVLKKSVPIKPTKYLDKGVKTFESLLPLAGRDMKIDLVKAWDAA